MAFKALPRDNGHIMDNMKDHAEGTDSAYVKLAESIPLNTVVFSASEMHLLELYDQLQELRLEHALLVAQNTVATGHHCCTFDRSTC